MPASLRRRWTSFRRKRAERRIEATEVKGQFTPDAPLPSITLKGVSIKGVSRVQYEEAVTAAQTDAQSALNQDRVPRAYQRTVKDYFGDLQK